MHSTGSVTGRAVLAVGLMIGFYVLALGVAAGLAYLPIAEAQYGNRIHIKLALFCLQWLAAVGALLALERTGWSIESRPGAPVTARRNDAEVAFIDVVQSLAGGSLTDEAWRAECERLGIGGLSLSV